MLFSWKQINLPKSDSRWFGDITPKQSIQENEYSHFSTVKWTDAWAPGVDAG